jgi:beta-lactamase regulating signal transducer with metallopeptidase domain
VDTLVYVGLGNALAATALALAVAAVARVCRSRPAVVRGLWLLVLLKLLTPPLLTPRLALPASWLAAAGARVTVTAPAEPQPAPTVEVGPVPVPPGDGLPDVPADDRGAAPAGPGEGPRDDPGPRPPADEQAAPRLWPALSWQQAVLMVWLGGSVAWWTVAGWRLRRFALALRSARPAPADVVAEARRLARTLGLAGCPQVLFVPGQVPPLLWAVLGPARVLLPAVLWDRLGAEQRATLLAHELAHLRRRDHWVRRLELAALGLYWWHPVAWWARRQIQEAEEQCCDAWVVAALPGAARAYAQALLMTLAFVSDARRALPAGASGVGPVPLLKRRFAMILQGTTPGRLSRPGLAALLGLGALLLPLLPTRGQTTPRPAGAPAADPAAAQAAERPSTVRDAAPVPVTREPVEAARAATEPREPPAPVAGADDEVELLQAQLDGKKADVQEAQALLQQGRRQLARQEALAKRGAGATEELEQARDQVTVLEARLRGKEAQAREAELRLKHAQRRGNRPRPAAPSATPATSSYDRPAPKPTAAPGDPSPAAPGAPAGRTDAGLAPPPVRKPPGLAGGDAERRLRDLEKKLDALLREVEALRRDMAPARPGTPGNGLPEAAPTRSGPPGGVAPPASGTVPGAAPAAPAAPKPTSSSPAAPTPAPAGAPDTTPAAPPAAGARGPVSAGGA